MDQEIKKIWVEALRSGAYEQGKTNLQKDGKFCCLGVLCDALLKNKTIKGTWHPNGVIVEDVDVPCNSYLPGPVSEKIDLLPTDEITLVAMNDGDDGYADIRVKIDHAFSFNEIADWIEEKL